MINWNTIERIYLIGIGGIGMSALARYYKSQGKKVAGYDRIPTSITKELSDEGIILHHNENPELIPNEFRNPENTLVIYTPAVPEDHKEIQFFRTNGFTVMKRSEVLGKITGEKKTIAVSGTHGKTTTTTMVTHILKLSALDCNAFLGGISKNYNNNLLLSKTSDYTVVEADEYDRSFLHLSPLFTVVTSIDAEHLDIYGTHEAMIETYHEFLMKIRKNGTLLYKKESPTPIKGLKDIKILSYSVISEDADFHISNLKEENGFYSYDLHTPKLIIKDITLGLPGFFNVENSVAAAATAYNLGIDAKIIKRALKSFLGVKRRFDYQICTNKMVYIDDYAHHPEELKACITSARKIFKNKKITGIFQPHLYSRTRDFAKDFGESLSLLDQVYLLEIYPAREKPIEGVSSKIIFDQITISDKILCTMDDLLDHIEKNDFEVVITMGAGNIDKMVQPIRELLEEKMK
jgi:UDP-N-acetylmuramate--alanine ligase